MKGRKAWSIIQPHIDPMKHEEFNTKEFAEAYCTVFIACKEMDERSDKSGTQKQGCTNCKYLKEFLPWDCNNEYNKPLPNHKRKGWCCTALAFDGEVMQIVKPKEEMCEMFKGREDEP